MTKANLSIPLSLTLAAQAFAGWETLPPLPEPNGGFTCAAIAGKIVVLGGTNWRGGTKHWLDGIWVFDPATREWKISGKLPNSLAFPVAGNWKGDLILVGGSDGTQPRKEVWRLKPSMQLEQIGSLTDGVAAAVGVVLKDDVLLLGGCADPASLLAMRSDGLRFHLPGGAKSPLNPPGDVPFGLAATVAMADQLFVFGGAAWEAKELVNLRQSWAFSIRTGKWRSLQPLPLTVRGISGVSLDRHRLLVGGGYGGTPENFNAAAFVYDIRKNTYARTTDFPTAGMVGLVRVGDFVYCLGGEDKMKHRSDACFRIGIKDLLAAAKRNAEQSLRDSAGKFKSAALKPPMIASSE